MTELAKPHTTNAHLHAVGRQVCDRYRNVDIAFISGSLVEGFGNETSDLDVFVLSDTAIGSIAAPALAADLGAFTVDIDFACDIRTDTEIWTVDAVADIAAQIDGCDPMDWRATMRLDKAGLELAHRVRVGEPLIAADRFARLGALFDWRRLGAVLAQRFLQDYSESTEDAVGAVKAGDAGAGLLNSRLALGAAADALCAVRGATNGKAKWRLHRLAATSPEVTDGYLGAELDCSTEPADLLRTARNRLRVASDLADTATAALLDGTWDER
jgi:hypothetical protein